MPSNRLAAGRGPRASIASGNQALRRFASVALITMFLAPSARAEALAEPYQACLKIGSDQQIESCSAAIQSGKWSGKDLAWAYNNRGFAYFLAGDLDRAFADDNEAIRLDPNDAPAFLNRGTVYLQRDDLDHAIADFSETIRLDPNHVLAYNTRGLAYLSEAIRIEPAFVVAVNNRGRAYQAKGDLDHAIADFEQATRINPKYASAFNNLALAQMLKGDADRAISN